MIIEQKRTIINQIYKIENLTPEEYYGTEAVTLFARDCFYEMKQTDLKELYWQYDYLRGVYY